MIAVCDFGGTGTSITLADAANGFAPLAPTERHLDFSGDQVDQALLTHVVGGLSSAGAVDLTGTSAIGSLTRLRSQCRAAKERLSTASVTALAADLPGHGGDIRVTRTEPRRGDPRPLAAFVEELQQTLQRIGIRPADLAAVATVGGGARIPLVTTTLSEHLRVPIITGAHPELAAAIGGGLLAVRGTVVEDATSMAPAAGAAAAAAVAAAGAGAASAFAADATQFSDSRALAWSDADDVPDVAPSEAYEPQAYQPQPYEPDAGESARPRLAFAETEEPEQERRRAWYRNPFAVMAIALAVVFAAIGAAVLLTRSGDDEPASPSDISTTTSPQAPTPVPESTVPAPAPAPAPAEPGAGSAPPPQRTITRQPAPAPEAPPPSTEPPPPPPSPSTEPPPPPPPSTEPPPPPPSTQPPIIPTLPYPTIPGLPFVPAPVLPAP